MKADCKFTDWPRQVLLKGKLKLERVCKNSIHQLQQQRLAHFQIFFPTHKDMPLPLVTLIGVLLNATIGAAIFQAAEDREAAKHVPADVSHASVDKWIIPW
ncbi:hypothetical protein DYB25_003310 [Aphanomyces astaci]|uniref:Uncharacterized protein n=1 Tax=Aphanomyces astaci TaxID=112090 RepID=A0A397DFG5_APHAT|nr:hypothetical protein DYB36_013206 [Aphanomyces astaci]RHY07774.1 hypothetical protein DYB25_003310 [Aphanomyces astaci]RHY49748.1 hypothetical protein DYB34_004373 [Aphanomyces astaci]RHY49919.1 hypothetical protein DYB38_001354 [Aphanomyces astaci]RHY61483.1 hypothetical protein DYB30_000741 [Aphanomyces astaci]